MFSPEVVERLRYYVYRLIDPRNGDTFYVGKGKGNRVFSHIKEELEKGEDQLTAKIQRIKKIRASGFEVIHVIHRHNLDEDTAFELEAALIDAYPEVANSINGLGADDRGVMHADQIIEKYQAAEVEFSHNAVIININKSEEERASVYEAVRYAWRLNPKKAKKADIVLAVRYGLVKGVFVATEWLPATTGNFPGTLSDREGRWGFVGHEASGDIKDVYFRKRIPDSLRGKGMANPVRYKFINDIA